MDAEMEVARHLISSMFFVPCLSMDLLSLEPSGLEAIRRWIGFYRENSDFLRTAHRSVSTLGPVVTSIRAETLTRQIIGVFRPLPVDVGVGHESIILNASGSDELYLSSETAARAGVVVYDQEFNPGMQRLLTLDRYTPLHVPPGGYVRLHLEE